MHLGTWQCVLSIAGIYVLILITNSKRQASINLSNHATAVGLVDERKDRGYALASRHGLRRKCPFRLCMLGAAYFLGAIIAGFAVSKCNQELCLF